MRLISLLLILWTLTNAAYANACNSFLDPGSYRFGNHITMDPNLNVYSRSPEAGSLEERQPGVASAIVNIMNNTVPISLWRKAHPISTTDVALIYQELLKIPMELKIVQNKFAQTNLDKKVFAYGVSNLSRLINLSIERYNPFWPTSEVLYDLNALIRYIQSHLLELLIAVHYRGDDFIFNTLAKEYYAPQNSDRANGRWKRQKNDSEIDIIIKRADGPDIWIEAKNNAMESTIEDYLKWLGDSSKVSKEAAEHFFLAREKSRNYGMNDSVLDQLGRQRLAQNELGLANKVKIILVTKNPIPKSLEQDLRRSSFGYWPIYLDPSPFLPFYFESLTNQLE